MRGVRAEQALEPKAGGAFLASLLVHGVVIAGIASIPALRPGLPHPAPVPMMLMVLPAPDAVPLEDREPNPEALPEPVAVPPPPAEPAPIEPPLVSEVLPQPNPLQVLPIPPKPTVVAKKSAPRKPAPKAVVPVTVASVAPVAEPSTNRVNSLPDAPPSVPAAPAAPAAATLPLITEAQYRERVAPVYPPRAAALDQQGEAVVRVRVGPDGEQEEVLLWRSSGFALLDRAALTAVRHSRFEPFRHNGTAFAAWVEVPVRFTLN